ncbi:helix-turn-helix domain-containing protein [Enterococcus faecium]|nr:helix-turn-helix domain-containing protein [Enterococcus faecium]
MLKAFKFRMYPTEEQKQQLIRTFDVLDLPITIC